MLPRTQSSWRRLCDRLATECHTLRDRVAELEAQLAERIVERDRVQMANQSTGRPL